MNSSKDTINQIHIKMKKVNYNNLKSTYEAYEQARDMHYKQPDNLDYVDAVSGTYDNLIAQIRFILWDEAPRELRTPTNPDDLPF